MNSEFDLIPRVDGHQVLIDFKNRKCVNSTDARVSGSQAWGEDVSVSWNGSMAL